MKWKNDTLLIFGPFFSKSAFFEVVTFVFSLVLIQSTKFLSGGRFNKIRIFDEAFLFLTIRMPMVTKIFRVVTYRETVPPINLHGTSMVWFCEFQDKYTYLHLQKTYGHQIRQAVDLLSEPPDLKASWCFVHVTKKYHVAI